jgi:diguanylate cyclase (GGDEF)-like protein
MINDMRGHATGDAIIAIIADAIRDSICEGDECARIGDDKFFVFAADCTTNEAMAIGRRILDNLAKPTLPLSRAHASVSIGVVVFGGAEAEFNRMYYRDADHALYQARCEGKAALACLSPMLAIPWTARLRPSPPDFVRPLELREVAARPLRPRPRPPRRAWSSPRAHRRWRTHPACSSRREAPRARHRPWRSRCR